MASHVGVVVMQYCSVTVQNECSERRCSTLGICYTIPNWSNELRFRCQTSKISIESVTFPRKSSHTSRHDWRTGFAFNTVGIYGDGSQEGTNGNNSDLGSTRLGRIVSAGGRQLLEKLNTARKNFPMKIFLLLLGFYTANALATILGQTGDWDVLVAGVVVAAIEGIGMLMYRKPPSQSGGRLQTFVVLMNYWKAGVCLGLFVDAFKLGS